MKVPRGSTGIRGRVTDESGKPRRVAAPMRDVICILEVEGPKGGVVLVHVLTCGHWVTRRSSAAKVTACIGCAVEGAIRREASA